MTDITEQTWKKVILRQALTRIEIKQLRREWPQTRLNNTIARLEAKKGDLKLITTLKYLDSILYKKVNKKTKKIQYTADGKVVRNVISGGLPTLGKKK